jgi:predicted molibdopterin-dependent oxidoreductase YjgC
LVSIRVDGRELQVPRGQSLAAALANQGVWSLGEDGPQSRQVICAMGSCFACRVRIEGRSERACKVRVRAKLEVDTKGVGR